MLHNCLQQCGSAAEYFGLVLGFDKTRQPYSQTHIYYIYVCMRILYNMYVFKFNVIINRSRSRIRTYEVRTSEV